MYRGHLRQSTAVSLPLGPFLDSTDGNTQETGLTITQPDIRLKKNAGNWGQKSAAQTLTHEEAGYYEVDLSTTDTDTLGLLHVACHESGALAVCDTYEVISQASYDLMFGSLPQGMIAYGTAQSATSSTIVLAAATSISDDLVNASVVYIISGTGAGQSRVITDFVSSSDTVTVSPNWVTNPDATSVYCVMASPPSVTTLAALPSVNVEAVNGITIIGAGTSGDKFRA